MSSSYSMNDGDNRRPSDIALDISAYYSQVRCNFSIMVICPEGCLLKGRPVDTHSMSVEGTTHYCARPAIALLRFELGSKNRLI